MVNPRILLAVGLCLVLVRGSSVDSFEEEHDNRSNNRQDELYENKFERLEKRREPAVSEGKKVGADAEIIKLPILPVQKPCCEPGVTIVDLQDGGVRHRLGGAAGVFSKPTGSDRGQCSKQAVLKVKFDNVGEYKFCQRVPSCGRRMLRIELELSSSYRSGWMFNIGDSKSNNGYAGDSTDQSNDAELQGKYPYIRTYASDKCKSIALKTNRNALLSDGVSKVTIYVSDEHVRVINDNGLDEYLCHECLFALNGQQDKSPGGVNEEIYIGLNRVIANAGRRGVGVCSAKLSWVCPSEWNWQIILPGGEEEAS